MVSRVTFYQFIPLKFNYKINTINKRDSSSIKLFNSLFFISIKHMLTSYKALIIGDGGSIFVPGLCRRLLLYTHQISQEDGPCEFLVLIPLYILRYRGISFSKYCCRVSCASATKGQQIKKSSPSNITFETPREARHDEEYWVSITFHLPWSLFWTVNRKIIIKHLKKRNIEWN